MLHVEDLRAVGYTSLGVERLLKVQGPSPSYDEVLAALKREGVCDVRFAADEPPPGKVDGEDDRQFYHARLQHITLPDMYFNGTDVNKVRAILSAYRNLYEFLLSISKGDGDFDRDCQLTTLNPDAWLYSYKSEFDYVDLMGEISDE
jgi:hypothetical protein